MTIERLGPIDPLQNARKTGRAERAKAPGHSDSINLSSEAREKGEVYQALEIAKLTPEVRADKVAELKQKIKDPDYLNEAVISMTADRIIDQLFG